MKKVNPKIDAYLEKGCGRCQYFSTPDCKVHRWQDELVMLRKLMLETPMQEELKWRIPCYTLQSRNIVLLAAFKEYIALSFPNGALLKDTHKLLVKPGDNSQATRQLRFTNVDQIVKNKGRISDYIEQAIKFAQDGKKVAFKTSPEPTPKELEDKFNDSPKFKAAFESLTPGRQRAYILFISAAKQSKTRSDRIEKYTQKILDGKGIND